MFNVIFTLVKLLQGTMLFCCFLRPLSTKLVCVPTDKNKFKKNSNTTQKPLTIQCWVLSPDSLTAIHIWAHLALATHMKAG